MLLVDAVVGRHVCTYTLDWFHKSQGLVNIEGYDPFRVSICSVLVRACALTAVVVMVQGSADCAVLCN